MILGDCVLLGESGLDADVWKPGYDRPCAVVIWGGWCVLLGSIKPSLAVSLTPGYASQNVSPPKVSKSSSNIHVSLDSERHERLIFPVSPSQSGLHAPSAGYLNT